MVHDYDTCGIEIYPKAMANGVPTRRIFDCMKSSHDSPAVFYLTLCNVSIVEILDPLDTPVTHSILVASEVLLCSRS